jgi:tRNA 2-thiouridine synthesizing protein A
MSDYELDARQLICPMPVIRTQDRIKQLLAGDRLTVVCSDPGAKHDIPAWCRIHGHTVESVVTNEEGITVVIRVEEHG